jgi:hypothetical protein
MTIPSTDLPELLGGQRRRFAIWPIRRFQDCHSRIDQRPAVAQGFAQPAATFPGQEPPREGDFAGIHAHLGAARHGREIANPPCSFNPPFVIGAGTPRQ